MEVVDPGRRGTRDGFHRPGPGVVPDAQRVGLRAVDDLQDARAAQQLRRGVNGLVEEQGEAESLSAVLRTALTPGTRVRADRYGRSRSHRQGDDRREAGAPTRRSRPATSGEHEEAVRAALADRRA